MSASVKPEQIIREDIRALRAYPVPDPGNCVKLDAMENPYRWPPALIDDWLAGLRDVEINRYPDPGAARLIAALRPAIDIPDDMSVLPGNGSDELIQMLALAVAAPDRVVMAPEPTFVMYRMLAQVTGMRYVGVPLTADFALDLPAFERAIDEHRPVLVFLAYPNNPTGNLFDGAAIERLIRRTPGLVVVDEAYAPFTDASFMRQLGEFDNLLVLRTLSKMGLAGLRLGLLAGPAAWLDEIDKTRLPYNINVLTQASVAFAARHLDVLMAQAGRIREDRSTLYRSLAALPGLEVYASEANFILFRTPPGAATPLFDAVRRRGVLIKNLSGAGGALADCLRVTVGTPDENRTFLTALAHAIEELAA